MARAVASAVAGARFDLDLITELAGDTLGLEDALERGLIAEVAPGHVPACAGA